MAETIVKRYFPPDAVDATLIAELVKDACKSACVDTFLALRTGVPSESPGSSESQTVCPLPINSYCLYILCTVNFATFFAPHGWRAP